ncbi:hypothetical protein RF11_05200 [Thelohanellus kitauei]|uniref:Alpha-soluble NSF attachment protein n=1 Tax=Thelohanellus kitauei TaxID=669202 RepID=A0A0C2M6B1_THEKT|nr:hypothetical protein RF11_05200 [Thelohanellus kitauei]
MIKLKKNFLHSCIFVNNTPILRKAGNAYIKAAEFADAQNLEFEKIIGRYQDAANCFLRIKDNSAFTIYMNALDVYLKKGYIDQAIERCVRWGYKCEKELGDPEKAEEFYKKAEELRGQQNQSHTCVITDFEAIKYKDNLEKAWEVYEKFDEKVEESPSVTKTRTSVCRNCIDAYEKLTKHVLDLCQEEVDKHLEETKDSDMK